MFSAIESVGREVLIIKDNKVIGEGYSQTMAHGMVSVEMRDERAKALIADSLQVAIWAENFSDKKFKYSMYKYCQYTGSYLDMAEDDPNMKCDALEGTRAVDAFNFRWGLVPEEFKGVEGFRSALTQV